MPGGPAARGNRDMWPAGPYSEVHHLGYDPSLHKPGALQQSSGMQMRQLTGVLLLIETHTHAHVHTHMHMHRVRSCERGDN